MNPLARYVLLVPLLAAPAAQAGPYTDDLSKCLVESTTKDDRIALVRWMFTAASAHPAVGSLVAVSPELVDQGNKATAELFTHLLTVSCRERLHKALSYEGSAALQASFTVLGQVAGVELFGHAEVVRAMSGLQRYLDASKFEALKK